jgi:hypothetical protein
MTGPAGTGAHAQPLQRAPRNDGCNTAIDRKRCALKVPSVASSNTLVMYMYLGSLMSLCTQQMRNCSLKAASKVHAHLLAWRGPEL